MKTDALFYELFKIDPQVLPRLLGLELSARYAFHSITVKQTEKRFDGYFEPVEGDGPLLFLEIQGYNDPRVYWRLLREVATAYEQRKDEAPFVAVVLFLDGEFAPKRCQFRFEAPSRLIAVNLVDCLKALREGAGALAVLKPLVIEGRDALEKAIWQWKAELESLDVPAHERRQLLDLLEYAILQRFPTLTLKEIQTMLQLTPLDETVAGRELIDRGIETGLEKGLEKGLEQGRRQMLLKLLQLKFGPLSANALERLEAIHDPAALDVLAEKVLTSRSLEELGLG